MDLVADIQKLLYTYNQNYLALVTGKPGGGKSYSAMRLAEKLDPRFNIKKVCFTPKQFLKNLDHAKQGDTLIIEEAGIQLDSRLWWRLENRTINWILESFRYQNLACLFTTPSIAFCDSMTRRLFNALVETVRIDRQREEVVCKYFYITQSIRKDKPFYKYPHTIIDGKKIKVIHVLFPKPSMELITLYEKKKVRFARALRKELGEQLNASEGKPDPGISIEDMAKEVYENKKSFQRTYNKRTFVDKGLIQSHFNIPDLKARTVKVMVEQKKKP